MSTKKIFFRAGLLICALVAALALFQELSQASSSTPPPGKERDGQHDFDFNIGTWKTHVSRLAHPLTGSKRWVEYDGTSVVTKVWTRRVF